MPTPPYRIAVFASGSGTNAEKIFEHFQHHPGIAVAGLLSNNPNAFALQRAAAFGIDTLTVDKQQYLEGTTVLGWLREKKITHIVLAGFLWMIPAYLLEAYPEKIVNIHPALLPAHGGKGMYGMRVHQAVKAAGDSETGITIHRVNEHYDEGEILFQAACPVEAADTPETIAQRVHALEHAHYPAVIEQWILS